MDLRKAIVVLVAATMAAACGVANPFAPSGASANSKQGNQELALKFAQCMRQHGVNMPDPNGNGQFISGSTNGPASSTPPSGVTTQGIDPSSPRFQAAESACKQYEPQGARAGGPPSQAEIDALTKFAQCMRQHGVNMSDPQVDANGRVSMQAQGTPGSDPNSDQFQQAQQACQHLMPGGGPKGAPAGARTTR